jgi:hypothetical protein
MRARLFSRTGIRAQAYASARRFLREDIRTRNSGTIRAVAEIRATDIGPHSAPRYPYSCIRRVC